jgi:hypothetical protein
MMIVPGDWGMARARSAVVQGCGQNVRRECASYLSSCIIGCDVKCNVTGPTSELSTGVPG